MLFVSVVAEMVTGKELTPVSCRVNPGTIPPRWFVEDFTTVGVAPPPPPKTSTASWAVVVVVKFSPGIVPSTVRRPASPDT
jgi:hypothetical protein